MWFWSGILYLTSSLTLPAATALSPAGPSLALRCPLGRCSVGPMVLLVCGLAGNVFWDEPPYKKSFSSHFSQGTLWSTVRAEQGKGLCIYSCYYSIPVSRYSFKSHHNVIFRCVDLTPANPVFNVGSLTPGENSGKLITFTVPLFPHLWNGITVPTSKYC